MRRGGPLLDAARLAALLLLFVAVAVSAASSSFAAAKHSSSPAPGDAAYADSPALRWADAEAHLVVASPSSRPPAVQKALEDARDRLASKQEGDEEEEEGSVEAEQIAINDTNDEKLLVLGRRHRRKKETKLPPVLTNRPLIGILSQPGDPATGRDSYIAASYVKFVEASGARVIPFFHDAPAEETDARFAAVNGVLIPGGAARLSPGHTFFDVAARVIDLATDANLKKKEHFPVFAICLGFEALGVHLSGNASLLSAFDAEDTAAPLYFTEAAERSRLFGSMPRKVRESLASKPFARESHSWGISLASFEGEEKLKDQLEVLSLSSDPEGRVYVSSMEHKTLPFSATQW